MSGQHIPGQHSKVLSALRAANLLHCPAPAFNLYQWLSSASWQNHHCPQPSSHKMPIDQTTLNSIAHKSLKGTSRGTILGVTGAFYSHSK